MLVTFPHRVEKKLHGTIILLLVLFRCWSRVTASSLNRQAGLIHFDSQAVMSSHRFCRASLSAEGTSWPHPAKHRPGARSLSAPRETRDSSVQEP